MEDYAAKMALKPDAALREYVTGHAQYREEAVLAALNELRQRGQPAPEDTALRPQLEAVVQKAQAAADALAAEAPETDVADLPRLFSPAGIVVVSATLSVVAGAVLLALNLYRLKKGNIIIWLVAFVVAYVIARALLLKWLIAQHLFSPWIAPLIDLPVIVAYVWWFWPRYIGTYQFQPRNWLLPLGVFMLVIFVVLLLNPGTAQQLKEQIEQQMQQR
ncbi:hypothetical protein QMK33_22235 [Hymenobacter sp. H14-R3]|uniref:hypothetical protein n=1 Tax=Hymenobacter sp. H14-R3 TaxID=3046308 RepID=UPI0024BB56DC|nr:hypothetical protein [Hymenobacter sp. H14-R3]MDJ0367873.1 hypothetical protein [Hymenobacter sp. H14-R3]